MITYTSGNILLSEMQTIAIPVNCVGVTGAGLAKQWAAMCPPSARNYNALCRDGRVSVGETYLLPKVSVHDKRFLLFPTKKHWNERSEYFYIESGLRHLRENLIPAKVKSIALPRLGCGLGGLRWNAVRALIEEYLEDCGIPVEVYGE